MGLKVRNKTQCSTKKRRCTGMMVSKKVNRKKVNKSNRKTPRRSVRSSWKV